MSKCYNYCLHILISFFVMQCETRKFKKTCATRVKFTECNAETGSSNPMWKLAGTVPNHFDLDVQPGCEGSDLDILWELRDKETMSLIQTFPKYKNKAALTIDRYVLTTGEYVLRVEIFEIFEGKSFDKQNVDCWIKSAVVTPVPVLKGGEQTTAHVGEIVSIDGSQTMEFGIKDLKYSWKCNTTSGSYKYCDELSRTKGKIVQLTIEAKTNYNITLTVSSNNVNESMTQEIIINDSGAPSIKVVCSSNCLEEGNIYVNGLFEFTFQTKCTLNCEELHFKWDITGNVSINISDEGAWSTSPVGYDKQINVFLTVNNSKGIESTVNRKIMSKPDLNLSSNCTISPKNGISLVTNFNIICNVTKNPRPVTFFVGFNRTRDDGKCLETIIAYGSVPEFNIKLASNNDSKSEIFIAIEDDTLVLSVVKLTVEVNSFLNKSDGVATMINLLDVYNGKTNYSKSVSSLIKLGKYPDALQTMNALVTEQETLEDNEDVSALKTKLTIKMLEDMKQIELNRFSLSAAVYFVGHFILDVQNTDPIDLNLATLLSEYCKKLGGELNRTVNTDSYPYRYTYDVLHLVRKIYNCAEYVLKRGAERPQGFNIEKPKAMKEHPTIDEDYPNYKDTIPESLEQDYFDLLINSVKTLDEAGFAYVRTITPGSIDQPQQSQLSIVKASFVAFMSDDPMILNETSISLPKELHMWRGDHLRIVYTLFQMSEIEKFNTGRYIQTSILSLNMFLPNKVLRQLEEPLDYFFTTDESDVVKNYTGQVTVPTSESDWIPKIIDFNMTVIRIVARRKSAIFARFYDIDPVKEILVVVTKFQRPKYEDFKNAQVVNHTSSILLPMVDEDTWYYLGILPKKEDALKKGNEVKQEEKEDAELRQRFGGDYSLDMNSDEQRGFTATFNYQLLSQLCVEWQDGKWTPTDCEIVKALPPKFNCRCKVIGMLAGHQSNAEHKEDVIKKIHFNIKLQLSFVIYIATTVVIALYCIAICFIILRALSLRKLYFLSDNLKDERYAYFIIVNTSSWAGSGTTSNVTIKMHGSKYESKAHVLNYPDPDKEILQRSNQDWFILTTRKHLGEITHIQLWYDCIGYRPDWYCDNVRIYDLQTEGMWNFVVKQKFTVLKNSTHHYILKSLASEQIVENSKMKITGFSFGERHTWNIFIRSDDENFSYTERITVVLSHILCTYALALYICYAPSVRLKDGLGHNYFDSYGLLVMYSTLVAVLGFSANIIFVILFRNITRTSTVFHFRKIKKILPPFMKDVTWFLLIGTILTTAIYLITCGFWISFTSSMVWLTVTTLALIINIFILENLYLLLNTCVYKYLSKKLKTSVKYNFDSIIIETEKQRKMLYGKLGIYGLRPYLSHLYKPLSREVLVEKRRREVTKAAIANAFKDMIYFLLYTILLYILLYVNLDDISAVSTEHVKDMFEDGRFAPFGGINKVHDTESLYRYLNETFIPTVHSMHWYGQWNVSDPGLMGDFNTKVLGVARLRQKRVNENACPVTFFMKRLNVTRCIPEYTHKTASRENLNKNEFMWAYQSNKNTTLPTIIGHAQIYSGHGYMVKLGRTINNAYYMVTNSRKVKWIDELTRVIFLEFLMYNANANLFNAVTVIFERSATQYMVPEIEVFTGRLCYADIYARTFSIVIFTIFLIIIIRQTCRYLQILIITRLKYLTKFTNLINTSVHLLNIYVLYLFLVKEQMTMNLLRKLGTSKYNVFVPYFNVLKIYNTISVVTAILIAIGTIRIWNFLRFFLTLRIFERALLKASKYLLGLLLYTLLILLMFGFATHMMLHSLNSEFKTMGETVLSLMKIIFHFTEVKFDYDLIYDYHELLGYCCIGLFNIFSFVLLKLYAIVIIMNYAESRNYYSNFNMGYSIKEYIISEYHYLSELCRRRFLSIRLRAGEDFVVPEDRKVTPKADAHRYANSVLLSEKKLNAMSLIVRGIIRNLYSKERAQMSKPDTELMDKIVRSKLPEDSSDSDSDSGKIFFKGKTEKGKVKFVSDVKLLQMEYVVKNLLSSPLESKIADEEKQAVKDNSTLKRINRIEGTLDKVSKMISNIDAVLIPKQKHSNTKT